MLYLTERSIREVEPLPVSYANLQLMLPPQTEAAAEKIYFALCTYMDAQGFIPCRKESAERTVAFVRGENSWTLFDDCADRLDINALDGLGRTLSRKLHVRAVGVMGNGRTRTLRLYTEGFLRDIYITAEKSTGLFRRRAGHALRWYAQLADGHTVRELADAFSRGTRGADVFPELQQLLGLDHTASFGFSSLEEVKPKGMAYMYFCTANRVRQRLIDRLWHTAPKTAKASAASCRMQKTHKNSAR